MTNRDRVIAYLKLHSEGVDDDILADALGFTQRQQANLICHNLADEGLVQRKTKHGKLHNYWVENSGVKIQEQVKKIVTSPIEQMDDYPWFWEGNVQEVIVKYLKSHDVSVITTADTLKKSPGKDIVAERNGKPLWISVKGYPKGTQRTSPTTQAGHWFKQVIFDILDYRGQDPQAELGVGLPDYHRYRTLATRIAWVNQVARFQYYWVTADGTVNVE